MNEKRRRQLSNVIGLLHTAESDLDSIREEEQSCMDSMPENLQSSERYAAMESAVDYIESAIDSVQEAADCVNEAISCG